MQTEIWKDIPDYEGLYQVSDLGNVKSLKRTGRILKPGIGKAGYLTVALCKNGIAKSFLIHQLVLIVFKNHIPNGYKLVCNHINFNKKDNRAVNLEILTNRENCNHKHLKYKRNYTGVYWVARFNKWSSKIWINGKSKHLGYFENEIDAHLAYQKELISIT